LILFSSDLVFVVRKKNSMAKLVIDAANEKIFLMIIINDNTYSITHDNSKINYEKLIVLINDFLYSKNLNLKNINKIYVNRGPGSFAGIRNSLSVVKALNLTKQIDYYCFSYDDFKGIKYFKYANIPYLCSKFKIEKNLINPNYIS
tara:strand:- start:272 stop:709 length:438 start_codon:yes stop_codon:yes gene_type:complete